jgi:cytochrome P450
MMQMIFHSSVYIEMLTLKDTYFRRMNKTLFRHSDVADPYVIYRGRLAEGSIHWDGDSDCWAVYSYEACLHLLMHPTALIPPSASEGLSIYAQMIKEGLVRLQNQPMHANTRSSTGRLFESIPQPGWSSLLASLLKENEIDWVEKVACRLPAAGILAGLGFNSRQQQPVLESLPRLVKIMQPAASFHEAALINEAAMTVGRCLEQRLPGSAVGAVCGLLIQSYDAGKGILCNALLHALAKGRQKDWPAFVTEVLRYDSPVHHTRRVAGEQLHIGEHRIRKGDKMILVLAAAGRDAAHFRNAEEFDIHRSNNSEHLAFGAGAHACLACDFVTKMTAECLEYIFHRWEVRLQSASLEYEPLFNVRLPRRMQVMLTKRALR